MPAGPPPFKILIPNFRYPRFGKFLLLLVLFTGGGFGYAESVEQFTNPALARAPTVDAGGPFVHPGGLHTKEDLDRMKAKVKAHAHPWIDDWEELIKDRMAQDDYLPTPRADMPSRQRAQDDASAMYLNALRWYISGDTKNAECAVRIANGWSAVVNTGPRGDSLSGIPVGSFALAGEVLRAYPGWEKTDFERFKKMLSEYWYPKCSRFLKTHNGDPPSQAWANWDACNMVAVLGIGVLCDDKAKFDQAVEYFKKGAGMGAIENAVPFRYPGGLGQWQESGRDHAHAMGGMGLLSEFCQVAWNQGVDLFGYDDNRLLAGAEYEAQYNLWKGVPYTFYSNSEQANQYYISPAYRGRLQASHFELLYNHYVVRKGLDAPNVKLFAELKRPEDRNVDVFGYGTLTYTLDAAASPYPAFTKPPAPRDLVASAGIDRVELRWSPSGAYTTRGYEVLRSTSVSGDFQSVFSNEGFTTPLYTDRNVENGKTYYYAVEAINQLGKSERSEPSAGATPVGAGPLPKDYASVDIGDSKVANADTYAKAGNNSFVVMAGGGGVGGEADSCHFVYRTVSGDFTITARFANRNDGWPFKTGVMMRESTKAAAKALAVTVGEIGGRQTRFTCRDSQGSHGQRGNDYTWFPSWFRLRRQGDDFTAFQSSDGITWFQFGETRATLAQTCLVGMVVAAGGPPGKPMSVSFDNVAIEAAPPKPPAAPDALQVIASSNNTIELKWTNPNSNQTGVKIEGSTDNKLFYEIADLAANATSFINTGVNRSTGHYYRIRAYNTGGYSAYSNSAGIAPSAGAVAFFQNRAYR